MLFQAARRVAKPVSEFIRSAAMHRADTVNSVEINPE
jgi:hypothetical protein